VSNNILIKDNFLDSIDELRELACNTEHMSHKRTPVVVGWRGYRSWELSHLNNPIINDCYQKILNTALEFFNVEDYSMEMYFHISNSDNKYHQLKQWHKDPTPYAGVLYLSPDVPLNSGTTIFDNGKRIDVDNKYNRLIVYPGKCSHGITEFIDDRRTVVVFIDTKKKVQKQIDLLTEIRLNS
jgi:hypothetical protein